MSPTSTLQTPAPIEVTSEAALQTGLANLHAKMRQLIDTKYYSFNGLAHEAKTQFANLAKSIQFFPSAIAATNNGVEMGSVKEGEGAFFQEQCNREETYKKLSPWAGIAGKPTYLYANKKANNIPVNVSMVVTNTSTSVCELLGRMDKKTTEVLNKYYPDKFDSRRVSKEFLTAHNITDLFTTYMINGRALNYAQYIIQSTGTGKYNLKFNTDFIKKGFNIAGESCKDGGDCNVYINGYHYTLSQLGNFFIGYNGNARGVGLSLNTPANGFLGDIYQAGLHVERGNYEKFYNLSGDKLEKRSLADELSDRPWYDAGYKFSQWQEASGEYNNFSGVTTWMNNAVINEKLNQKEIEKLKQEACETYTDCYENR